MFRSQIIFSGNWVWLATALLLIGDPASARDAVIDINLNLREGPGLPHRVVLVMPSGTTVKVGKCSGDWCQVQYRGQSGYVSSALVNESDSAYAAAPLTPPVATKYDPEDEVRIFQWQDRESRDRLWRKMGRQR